MKAVETLHFICEGSGPCSSVLEFLFKNALNHIYQLSSPGTMSLKPLEGMVKQNQIFPWTLTWCNTEKGLSTSLSVFKFYQHIMTEIF